ncbi:DUF2786 domain-containing protein [Prauserella endophytica]|uniref:DUF2786 domain-containing protein n=1 Tax=Prauserella endophytica TaxID=1592324 RepID=A0ABY2RWJ1_9PSEU|nr:DUF2786 domain-containing protein [Prauserella endophytica]
MNHATIARKVRALTARASHPGTPTPEADAALAKANELTLRYGLHDLDSWRPSPRSIEPVVVHWMSGLTPAGTRYRAWCRCGFGTTPRANRDRAHRALADSHRLDGAECMLCGVIYADTDWINFRRFLQVLTDPMTGDEYAMCINPSTCRARI